VVKVENGSRPRWIKGRVPFIDHQGVCQPRSVTLHPEVSYMASGALD
jgi:hypothetical protein